MKKSSKIAIVIAIVIVLAIAIVGIVLLANKGKETTGGTSKTPEKTYRIGDTVKTDIAEFTLNHSELAIALSNLNNETYYTPKEYNAKEDVRNPYVADTGHTLVYIDFTLSAIDRSTIDIDCYSMGFSKSFIDLLYKENTYYLSKCNVGLEKRIIDTEKSETGEWEKYTSSNILLSTSEKSQYKAYADIETKVENLKDKYYITFNLPNSEGKTTPFTYVVE